MARPITFDEVRIENPGISNAVPLEVTLMKGVAFTSVGRAGGSVKAVGSSADERTPGRVLVGYVYEKGDNYLGMSPDRLTDPLQLSVGAFEVRKDSIYGMRQLE